MCTNAAVCGAMSTSLALPALPINRNAVHLRVFRQIEHRSGLAHTQHTSIQSTVIGRDPLHPSSSFSKYERTTRVKQSVPCRRNADRSTAALSRPAAPPNRWTPPWRDRFQAHSVVASSISSRNCSPETARRAGVVSSSGIRLARSLDDNLVVRLADSRFVLVQPRKVWSPQFHRPITCMNAGTTAMRTSVASTTLRAS